MNTNSQAIKIFCSHLCVGGGVSPLEPSEWGEFTKLLHGKNLEPSDILDYSLNDFINVLQIDASFAERLIRLIDRSASLAFELGKYENMGVRVVTRADSEYPLRLKKTLGNLCPPLFYYAGDLQLLSEQCVGYVGSRTVDECDADFTKRIVAKTAQRGFGVVTGGARGIDSVSEAEGLRLGCPVIAFLSDSLMRRLKNGATVQDVQDGRLLLLSVVKPDAGFNAGIAMMRNRYIYAQSVGTVVVRSDFNKGGTWTGATENLRHGWCTEFCWDNEKYLGNKELIKRNAIPITVDWDGDIFAYRAEESKPADPAPTQMSLFDGKKPQ